MPGESALFSLAVEVLVAWQHHDVGWLMSDKVSSLLRHRNQYVLSSAATGEHDEGQLSSAWTWRGTDLSQFVQAWQGEFADARPFFQRLDEETLLAHVIFADETTSNKSLHDRIVILTFLAEEGEWRYHDATVTSNANMSLWSTSLTAAEAAFSQARSYGAQRSLQEDDGQDYWQLYDMELPIDPSAEVMANANERKRALPVMSLSAESFLSSASPPAQDPLPLNLTPQPTEQSTIITTPSIINDSQEEPNAQKEETVVAAIVNHADDDEEAARLERQLERAIDNTLALAEMAGVPPVRIKRMLQRLIDRLS